MHAAFASGMSYMPKSDLQYVKKAPLSYEKFEEAIPELKRHKYNVVIIGYKTCPYSGKAQSALKEHIAKSSRFREKSVFVGYEFGEAGPLKKQTGYEGTFPIVFVRDEKGHMEHVGGGVDFEYWVKKDLRK